MEISIIIRTYNAEKFIERAIKSALDQTLDKNTYEILVIDDGSTDKTVSILRKYRDKIRLIEENHMGPVAILNRALELSKGKYFIILDADDRFKNNILEKMIKSIDKNTSFVYCDYWESRGRKKKIVSLYENMFDSIAGGIMFRKEDVKTVNYYDENLIFAEYDLIIKLMKNNKKGIYLSEPLYIYNRNKGSITNDKSIIDKAIKQIKEKYGDIKIREY